MIVFFGVIIFSLNVTSRKIVAERSFGTFKAIKNKGMWSDETDSYILFKGI